MGDGNRCRHNWNVWRMNEWIGLGPSAASQRGEERWSNPASLDRWSNALADGRLEREEVISLGPPERLADALLFGLRLNEGIDLAMLARSCPQVDLGSVRLFLIQLQEEGLVDGQDERFWVTDRGRLVVDRVGAEVVDRVEVSA